MSKDINDILGQCFKNPLVPVELSQEEKELLQSYGPVKEPNLHEIMKEKNEFMEEDDDEENHVIGIKSIMDNYYEMEVPVKYAAKILEQAKKHEVKAHLTQIRSPNAVSALLCVSKNGKENVIKALYKKCAELCETSGVYAVTGSNVRCYPADNRKYIPKEK